MLKHKNIFILLFLIMVGGVVSCFLGPAIDEFDVLNYHIYAPWAFLTDRIGYDILPCGIRSYFNPILDIPYFLMVKYLNYHPYFVTFVQGGYLGLLLFFTYKLSSLLVTEKALWFNLFSVLITAFSAVIIWQTGTLYNDMQVGVLILAGLYFYLKTLFDKDSSLRTQNIIIAMCCLGAVSGLKLTSNLMILGIFLASLFMIRSIDKPVKTFCISFLTFVLSFLLVNGYWYYKIYSTFKNPFFPYFNHIFKSSMGANAIIANETYKAVLPRTLHDKIFYPFLFFNPLKHKSFGSWLFDYVDYRYPLMNISFFLLMPYLFFKKRINNFTNIDKNVVFLLLFVLTTYIIWLNFSPIIRYIIPVIVVSCILINYTIKCFVKKEKLYMLLAVVLFGMLFFTTKGDYSEIRVLYNKKLFDVYNYEIKDNSLVLLASQKISAVIPFLNKNAKYAMLFRPRNIELNWENAYFAYKSRTVDYYTSPYYEALIKEEINKAESVYLIYIPTFAKEQNVYYQSIDYYKGDSNWSVEDCTHLYGEINICKIIKK